MNFGMTETSREPWGTRNDCRNYMKEMEMLWVSDLAFDGWEIAPRSSASSHT